MKMKEIKTRYKLLIIALIVVSMALIFALVSYPYSRLISELAIPTEAKIPLLIFFALLPISLITLIIVVTAKKRK